MRKNLLKNGFCFWRLNAVQIHSHKSFTKEGPKSVNFIQAVTEAEKIVGYFRSQLYLNWLFTTEFMNIDKSNTNQHVLRDIARKLFIETENSNMLSYGLIALLVAQSYGFEKTYSKNYCNDNTAVLHNQRALAEITDMIHDAIVLHKAIKNTNKKNENSPNEFHFRNKIIILSGNYSISKSFEKLALLENSNLVLLISSSMRDLAQANFIGIQNIQTMPLPSKPIKHQNMIKTCNKHITEAYYTNQPLRDPFAEWTLRCIMSGGSLLANSCKGALILANHSKRKQKFGFLLGKSIALALQAKFDQQPFLPESSGTFSLMCAPVVMQLKHQPDFYDKIKKRFKNLSDFNYEEIRIEIQKGQGLKDTQKLQEFFCEEALNILTQLPTSDARTALENIINTL